MQLIQPNVYGFYIIFILYFQVIIKFNNYKIVDFKKDLCEFLFEKAVFKLFLHWSKTVRLVFHYFLLYRVSHLHKTTKIGGLDEE